MTPFPHTEKHLSQLPALQLLANLGYRILRPQEALQERQGKTDNIDLLKQLTEQYRIQKRGLMQKLLTGEWRNNKRKYL